MFSTEPLNSLSVGRRGATLNVGKDGTRVTVGIPGTGLSYTEKISRNERPENALLTTPHNVASPRLSTVAIATATIVVVGLAVLGLLLSALQ